jgi:hypothetical protein
MFLEIKTVAKGSMYFEWKIGFIIQVMHNIFYIKPYFNTYASCINGSG